MITAADIQTIRDNDPGAILPGIDTMTGNPYATSSLIDFTKITQNFKAPYYYNPTKNIVYVTQAGAVLERHQFWGRDGPYQCRQRHNQGLHVQRHDQLLGGSPERRR